jgi:hypothetical protein
MSFAETLSKEDLPDLAQFKNNILMLGFVYTFLFGGVGTNIISSVIISSKVDKVIDRLSRIEEILNEQKKASNVSNPKVSNRVLLYANGLVFVAMVTILLFNLA